jgi:hypothetical protein
MHKMSLYSTIPDGKCRSLFSSESDRLADLGATIIPIRSGTKKPAVRWKEYQSRTPSPRTLRRWFRQPGVSGLAVIHGSASSDLACRDYDVKESYDRWTADHPRLAKTLPTSISARGAKVYFRMESEMYRRLPDGELIGDRRHYSIVPPSIHPSGTSYTWAVPFITLPPYLDPVEVGLVPPAELEHNDYPFSIRIGESGHRDKEGLRDGVYGCGTDEIEMAIRNSLPTGYGERHHCLFRLARRLKAIAFCAVAKAEELLSVVQRWHHEALPHIRTKDFGESWKDFISAWGLVRSPGEGEILVGIKEWVQSRTDDLLMRLELACEVMPSRQGGQPFFLACRTAAALTGTSKTYAAKLLKQLVDASVLTVEEASDRKQRKAVTYRYAARSAMSTSLEVA